MLGVIAGPTTTIRRRAAPVPDYAAAIGRGVRGKRIGVPADRTAWTPMSRAALDGAIELLAKAGAKIVDVVLPAGFNEAARDWLPLCAVECAIAHEATYPPRAANMGRCWPA